MNDETDFSFKHVQLAFTLCIRKLFLIYLVSKWQYNK